MMCSLYLTYADDLRPAVCCIQAVRIAKNLGISSEVSTGVANAARTRDLLNHNQMLYQLSYSHHVLTSMRKRNEWILYTIFWMCARRRVALPAVK